MYTASFCRSVVERLRWAAQAWRLARCAEFSVAGDRICMLGCMTTDDCYNGQECVDAPGNVRVCADP